MEMRINKKLLIIYIMLLHIYYTNYAYIINDLEIKEKI